MQLPFFGPIDAIDVRTQIRFADLAKEGKLAPNHIMLNTFGNCLHRRNYTTKGNRNQRNFLQRQVAAARHGNIPLMHPEGTTCPNVFWASTEDNCQLHLQIHHQIPFKQF